jgi:hypothetical protein
MKRTQSAADKRHLSAVGAMDCIVCELIGQPGTPAQIHHVRERHGWGRSGHDKVIPLCATHHTGKGGVHDMGRDEFKQMYGYSEIELLEIVAGRIA